MTNFDLKGTLDRLFYFVATFFVAHTATGNWETVYTSLKSPAFIGAAVAAAFGLSAIAQKVRPGDDTAAIGNATAGVVVKEGPAGPAGPPGPSG